MEVEAYKVVSESIGKIWHSQGTPQEVLHQDIDPGLNLKFKVRYCMSYMAAEFEA